MTTPGRPSPTVISGPVPGLLGALVALHGRYYSRHWNFPVAFESKIARDMADFFDRYDPARDVVLSVGDPDKWLGSITVDGSDPGLADGQAHLRWFILDPAAQGRGLGRLLLEAALAFARRTGRHSIYLTTFRGLDAAAHLYAAAGFRIVDERRGRTWGAEVVEMRLELSL